MRPIDELSELEVRSELAAWRSVAVRLETLETAGAEELRGEGVRLYGLLGNAMAVSEALRFELLTVQKRLAELKGELQ